MAPIATNSWSLDYECILAQAHPLRVRNGSLGQSSGTLNSSKSYSSICSSSLSDESQYNSLQQQREPPAKPPRAYGIRTAKHPCLIRQQQHQHSRSKSYTDLVNGGLELN